MCVCVCFSHSFWTSSSLDVPAGVIQEGGHTGSLIHLSAVRALIFLARRIQPFLSIVDRETVSYEEIFPGNFGVGGVKNFLGKKKRFLRGNLPAKFPRPKFPRIFPAEEILKAT